ncbi:hypothetical protein MTR_2g006030 [Medicago truncatula]|uniref:Uncharacterized protein n=1 Tax=Medicago truncatula TaxID=3880 RepID=G7INM1_MEDTR|nr:hypothetical protein MTR_2g006030 [Medicago truncatula]
MLDVICPVVSSRLDGLWAGPVQTEACKGFLGPDGDWPSSAKAEGSLTARPTRRWKGRHSTDKSYPRDNRLIFPKSSHRREGLAPPCSSPPRAVVCSKGWAVRPLKRCVSSVQNVVRQFGPHTQYVC